MFTVGPPFWAGQGACVGGPSWLASTLANRNHRNVAFGNNRFVVGEVRSGNMASQWSADFGATWNDSSTTVSSGGQPVTGCFGGVGIFLFNANAVTYGTSSDGDAWTSRTHTSFSSNCTLALGDRFYFFSDSGSTNCLRSTDGNGTAFNTTTLGVNFVGNHGTTSGSYLVVIGTVLTVPVALYSSNNGANWSAAIGFPSGVNSPSMVAADGIGTVVAVGLSGVGSTYAYSTDNGQTYSSGSLPGTSQLWDMVIWAQGVFLVGSRSHAGLLTSTTGLPGSWATATNSFTTAAGFTFMAHDGAGHYVAINSGVLTSANYGTC